MSFELTVYYDGLCPLCSKEIEHYRKNFNAHRIQWVDITDLSFNADKEGLNLSEVQRSLHVKNEHGQVLKGVDSFIAIWEALDSYRPVLILAKSPLIRPILDISYSLFSRLRPFLPRMNRKECSGNYCHSQKEK